MIECLDNMINNKGIIFLNAAGNEGAALSTLGSPAGLSNSLICNIFIFRVFFWINFRNLIN